MVYFTEIRKTQHYTDEHEQEVQWSDVVEIIFKSAKSIRKKAGKYEIEADQHYILMELKGNVLYVVNAKRKR